MISEQDSPEISAALLAGGHDPPYALGLALALSDHGIEIDFVGSDCHDLPELRSSELIHFLNLRGERSASASLFRKVVRIAKYYLRLMRYAYASRARVFHILWNNKFELFDRTVLMAYYRLCGKRIVFTAHNVNAAARDGRDSRLNRFSLAVQYRLSDHILVHTDKMKEQLRTSFAVPEEKVSVIPFGINNTNPRTSLTRREARERLGLSSFSRVALFFGLITPYKGLEYLVAASAELFPRDSEFVLLIAGRVKEGAEQYWREIETKLPSSDGRVIAHVEYIPDAMVEVYFKAADVLVLPYVEIFQSGVLLLAYSFGLPVIATDVGSLREDVIEGQTGLICRPSDPQALADAIRLYFSSDLYRDLDARRARISRFANQKYSWSRVTEVTRSVYERLLRTS